MATSSDRQILVTGAGGFIGSYVVRRLRAQGQSVRAMFGPSDMPAGVAAGDCVCDVLKPDAVGDAVAGCDVVVHLAGPPSVAESFAKPALYASVHASGTATVLAEARRANLRRFVYVSSAEVYGQPKINPVLESAALSPRSPYGAAKAAAEWIVESSAIEHGHEAVILRPFSVFGHFPVRRSLVNFIFQQALTEDRIQLMSLTPVRDYVFIEDVAEAVAKACSVELGRPVVRANIGSGRGTSVRSLCEAVLSVVDRSVPIVETGHRDRPKALDIHELVANVSSAAVNFEWQPQTSLLDGLKLIFDANQTEMAA